MKKFFKLDYLLLAIFSNLGFNLVSELMHELIQLFLIELNYSSLKDPKSIGLVESFNLNQGRCGYHFIELKRN